MAVDDLHNMHMKRDELKRLRGDRNIGWSVQYGSGVKLLHSLFNPFNRKDDECLLKEELSTREELEQGERDQISQAEPARYTTFAERSTLSRRWTLTHSYFAST